MVVLLVVLGVVFLGFTIDQVFDTEKWRDDGLQRIARGLGGRIEGQTVIGRVRGLPVTYRLASRGVGAPAQAWTEIAVELPRGYPLELHVRRHLSTDQRRIASGEMIDVEVGDPRFDPMFLVEAAPADVARVLLDPDTRAYLMAHGQVLLDCDMRDGQRFLVVSMPGWQMDVPEALAAIATAVRIAGRVREAFAAVETAPGEVGSPYRAELDDREARAAGAAREREVAELRTLRAYRGPIDTATWIIPVVASLGILAAIVAAAAR